MKITNIREENDVYFVTKEPNFLERLFGRKTKLEKYKRAYHYKYDFFPAIPVFFDEDGDITGPTSRITKVLEKHIRKNEIW